MAMNCVEVKSGAKKLAHSSPPALSCDPLIQNHLNFKRSSSPKRFMFYDNGSWVDYSEDVADVMKLGFMEGKPMVEAQSLGLNSCFDFYRMLEIDLGSGKQRSISWIDVDGKCFFPKSFVNSYENDHDADVANCNENCTKIEIEVRVRDNSVEIKENSGGLKGLELNGVKLSKRKRGENVEKEKVEESLCSISAKKRHVVESELQSSRWPNARVLGSEEKGCAVVKKLFMKGLEIVEPGARVTVVHQCARTGPFDKARAELFTKQMEITRRARGVSNVVFAWYGTSAEGVQSILMHGFGIPGKPSRSEGHGIGIHLSPIRSPQNSAISLEMDENGEKHVILCRVILGKCEKVEAGSQQVYPSSIEYDTGVDDLNNPKWYTVWHANMNTHILPECVVSYRPNTINGSINCASKNGIPIQSMFVAKLFSKLRSSLPLPRFQAVQNLWGSCKEGKLGRDAFMRKLRSVVGDDVLRSTIQEIRG